MSLCVCMLGGGVCLVYVRRGLDRANILHPFVLMSGCSFVSIPVERRTGFLSNICKIRNFHLTMTMAFFIVLLEHLPVPWPPPWQIIPLPTYASSSEREVGFKSKQSCVTVNYLNYSANGPDFVQHPLRITLILLLCSYTYVKASMTKCKGGESICTRSFLIEYINKETKRYPWDTAVSLHHTPPVPTLEGMGAYSGPTRIQDPSIWSTFHFR